MFRSPTNKSLNKYPLWKYLLLVFVMIWAVIYALPNKYGEEPALQITTNSTGATLDNKLMQQVEDTLKQANIPFENIKMTEHFIQVAFVDTTQQLQAQAAIKPLLSDDYTLALSLAPATPKWLQAINAEPMKLGLDLRGGVHMLLDVDVNSFIQQRINGDKKSFADTLRQERVRYTGVSLINNNQVIQFQFHDQASLDAAYNALSQRTNEYNFVKTTTGDQFTLSANLTDAAKVGVDDYVIDQTMVTMRNRVDELGVSNAIVQRQGSNRISVDLPGVLDAGRAKQILGGTATLEFHLVDDSHDASNYINGQAPLGTKLYFYENHPILLKSEIVLQGSSITSAVASIDDEGRPKVQIRLGGGGEALFTRVTGANIGKQMAIVFVETKTDTTMQDGKEVKTQRRVERVISAPTIQSALPNSFEITGLDNEREANTLSLLLRAGALVANIDIAQEKTVGPTLGKENIKNGLISISIGFILVVIFMGLYYQVFGLIANIALFMNLVLLVAVLSVLGMVLTLPGMAGIVLTVGIAVDANVLIFERIREELRNGVSPQASIHAGFERAFSTIVDANVTTLIAALALFGIGTGPIKGFAVTLTMGILTSMITAIAGSRALVNLFYGGRTIKHLSIGIKVQDKPQTNAPKDNSNQAIIRK